ncbi:MAG: hypothetical protein ACM3X5_05355 [Bacillota bacterium]
MRKSGSHNDKEEHVMRTTCRLAGSLILVSVSSLLPVADALAQFGPIHVAANRAEYRGRGCPIDVIFTGSINFAMPHGPLAFNYHWERSDGAKSPQQVMRVGANVRSTVVREHWRLGAPGTTYDANATLFVNSGNEHFREGSPNVHIHCF